MIEIRFKDDTSGIIWTNIFYQKKLMATFSLTKRQFFDVISHLLSYVPSDQVDKVKERYAEPFRNEKGGLWKPVL